MLYCKLSFENVKYVLGKNGFSCDRVAEIRGQLHYDSFPCCSSCVNNACIQQQLSSKQTQLDIYNSRLSRGCSEFKQINNEWTLALCRMFSFIRVENVNWKMHNSFFFKLKKLECIQPILVPNETRMSNSEKSNALHGCVLYHLLINNFRMHNIALVGRISRNLRQNLEGDCKEYI